MSYRFNRLWDHTLHTHIYNIQTYLFISDIINTIKTGILENANNDRKLNVTLFWVSLCWTDCSIPGGCPARKGLSCFYVLVCQFVRLYVCQPVIFPNFNSKRRPFLLLPNFSPTYSKCKGKFSDQFLSNLNFENNNNDNIHKR